MRRTNVPFVPFRGWFHSRRFALLMAVTAIAFTLTACSSSASVGAPREAATTAAPYAAPPAVAVTEGQGGKDSAGGAGTAVQPAGPLIIRTGSLSLEVSDLDSMLLKARGTVVGLGGYVSDSERANSGAQATALITYRIPAARWDEATDALKALGTRILGEQTKAVDVTGQVIDIGARIDNLKATERALQAIMAQATKISDILDVQNQLTNVRGEIEQLSTQQAHLNDQAALGTLAVTWTLPVIAVAQATTGWNLSTEIDHAAAQLVQVAQGLAVAAVWLVVLGLPLLLGALLLIAIALYAARRLNVRRQPEAPTA